MTINQTAKQLLSLLDLTRLQEHDTEAAMQQWLDQMATPSYVPAAFCVYPEFIAQTRRHLDAKAMQAFIATVVNFPSGQLPLSDVLQQIEDCVAVGADEIDCVLPYQQVLQGRYDEVAEFLSAVRQACGSKCLKVIIESGELITPQQIIKATELCLEAGADFVKTSTGKVPVGCTTEAARAMLTVIAASGKVAGFKASGGVRTLAQAQELLQMFEHIMATTATAKVMRIGASALLDELKPPL